MRVQSRFLTRLCLLADESGAESTSGRTEEESWVMDLLGMSLRYLQVHMQMCIKHTQCKKNTHISQTLTTLVNFPALVPLRDLSGMQY